jgi:hypothetical protein
VKRKLSKWGNGETEREKDVRLKWSDEKLQPNSCTPCCCYFSLNRMSILLYSWRMSGNSKVLGSPRLEGHLSRTEAPEGWDYRGSFSQHLQCGFAECTDFISEMEKKIKMD